MGSFPNRRQEPIRSSLKETISAKWSVDDIVIDREMKQGQLQMIVERRLTPGISHDCRSSGVKQGIEHSVLGVI